MSNNQAVHTSLRSDKNIQSNTQVRLGDPDVRPTLLSYLAETCAQSPDTFITEELGICRGQVRVDVAVVNGIIHGYEIKSDIDNLRRLAGQVALYSQVLDKATLVVGEAHLHEAIPLLPSWWGVILIRSGSGQPDFEPLREASLNQEQNPRSMVELLWREQALLLLEERKQARGYRDKPRRYIWDRLCEVMSPQEISESVRLQLKARIANA